MRTRLPFATRPGAMLFAITLGCALAAQPTLAADPQTFVTSNQRVDRLLSQMTLEEKISLIHGMAEPAATDQGQAGYWPGLARLGIPAMRLVDGPPGVLTRYPSTGMTATMGLAATFSRQDAYDNGVVIGRDARALGQQIVLEPYINLFRDPTFVRAYNTFGEDPFLTGQMAAAQIKGTQSEGVMSQAKHYVAYDGGNDIAVDPQALREIYVAPFAAAVEAGVSSFMCAYNKVNGIYACGNDDTQNTILRRDLGFKGFITSDWGANHDPLFINRGLDLEMPGTATGMTSYFGAEPPKPAGPPKPATANRINVGPPGGFSQSIPEEAGFIPGPRGGPTATPPSTGMLAAVRSGQVSEADISRAVGRILLQMDRFGYLDHAPSLALSAEAVEANARIVQQTAEHAAVLLKNDEALPLSAQDLQSLVLVGPGALQTVAVGISGEKALGHVERQVGPYQALQKTLGSRAATVTYALADDMTGVAVPAAQLSHRGQPGMLRDDGVVDAELSFTKSNGKAFAAGSNHKWAGDIAVAVAGRYFINLQILGASGSFSLDGQKIGDTGSLLRHGNVLQPAESNVLPTTDGLDNVRRVIDLSAGRHSLAVDINGDASGGPVQVRLAWSTPEQRQANYAAAIAAAKAAKTAVVFVWSRGKPAFALPGDQDQLITDIAAVNSHTIVVLNVSQPIAMPWLNRVKAVLQMWYPGDEGGWATANVLLGRVNPAGRLPFSWPAKFDDNVAVDPRRPERSSVGVNGTTQYSEGIFMGYRWYDQQQVAPLFPFGFGLSYTRFEYSDLRVTKAGDGGLDVALTLHNSGSTGGEEVPQFYLGAPANPPAGAQFALRSLVGFDRVNLKAGERKSVQVHVPLRQLQYWDTATGSWKLTASMRPLYVGASSRDLRLRGVAAP
jgi:beta-glucosidase